MGKEGSAKGAVEKTLRAASSEWKRERGASKGEMALVDYVMYLIRVRRILGFCPSLGGSSDKYIGTQQLTLSLR